MRPADRRGLLLLALLPALLLASVLLLLSDATGAAEPCADRDPLRRAYFGDLHVHTRYSLDASTQGTRTTPEEAYRFARGEEVTSTWGLRAKLSRPLDWLVISDHAELYGLMPELLKGFSHLTKLNH